DPFGLLEEFNSALKLIPAETRLMEIEGAGHDLLGKSSKTDLPERIVAAFQQFFGRPLPT
ncbi:MAG TPA: alpha/beta hydrolase, partial [Terriglobales bacterium]